MKAFQETTVWDTPTHNHVYFLDNSKSKMFAYVKHGTDIVFKFKKPIRIDTRGRKFLEVPNRWNFEDRDAPVNPQWTVTGSKGNKYTVEKTENGMTCTCSGFKFRGNCKHTESITQEYK
jgi:hypothetical protein